MKSKLTLLTILFVSAYTNMQGQTVIYSYNAQGSCTSRVYANGVQKAKIARKKSPETSPTRVEVSPSATFDDAITISLVGNAPTNGLAYVLANVSGQVAQKGSFAKESVTLVTSNLPQGIYILKVSGDNYEHSCKMQKK